MPPKPKASAKASSKASSTSTSKTKANVSNTSNSKNMTLVGSLIDVIYVWLSELASVRYILFTAQ